MKIITILYQHSIEPSEITLEDEIANKLYNDIYNARIAGETTLQINGNTINGFINPTKIVECMLLSI